MLGLDGESARAEEVEEGYETLAGSGSDNAEELDEACTGIGG
jgi:hypothetical protein